MKMPVNLNWRVNVSVSGGPQLELSQDLVLDAYDSVSVAVPAGESMNVEVQPGDSDKVHLLIIQSNHYGSDLKYKVDGGSGKVELDQPQILSGPGAVGLLGAAPQTIEITNDLDKEAAICIFTGRKASTS